MEFDRMKAKYPDFMFEIEQLSELLEEHSSRHIDKILPSVNTTKPRLGRAGILYLQMVLSRSQALLQGFLNSLDCYNPLTAFLVTRAHYEVTGCLAYFIKKLHNVYKNEISLEELNEFVGKLGAGSKLPEFKEEPDPVQVMTLIDAVDYLFKVRDRKRYFRESYDLLSEFCHPNMLGVAMAMEINKVGVIRFKREPEFRDRDINIITYFLLSVNPFIEFYDEALNLLFEHGEEFPVMVCNVSGRKPTSSNSELPKL